MVPPACVTDIYRRNTSSAANAGARAAIALLILRHCPLWSTAKTSGSLRVEAVVERYRVRQVLQRTDAVQEGAIEVLRHIPAGSC